jgi:hypothetical protein
MAMLAALILTPVLFNPGLVGLLSRRLIGVSDFFESAAAAVISLFGFQSGAAVASGRCAGRISSHGRRG